MRAGDSIQH